MLLYVGTSHLFLTYGLCRLKWTTLYRKTLYFSFRVGIVSVKLGEVVLELE